jgi:MYXO-CTERM domain-containing protein
MIKGKLYVEFVRQALTSYSGLEVLRRYLQQRELPSRLRAACAATGGDYGGGRLPLLVLALLYVGARRLEHLRYVAGDPLIARFCGLARIPTARTGGRPWPNPLNGFYLGRVRRPVGIAGLVHDI